MAEIRVNPTRMELKNIGAKLATARRGHKLLKDKCDELMRRFLDIVREDKALRASVEARLSEAHRSFAVASAEQSPRWKKRRSFWRRRSSAPAAGSTRWNIS